MAPINIKSAGQEPFGSLEHQCNNPVSQHLAGLLHGGVDGPFVAPVSKSVHLLWFDDLHDRKRRSVCVGRDVSLHRAWTLFSSMTSASFVCRSFIFLIRGFVPQAEDRRRGWSVPEGEARRAGRKSRPRLRQLQAQPGRDPAPTLGFRQFRSRRLFHGFNQHRQPTPAGRRALRDLNLLPHAPHPAAR